MKIRVFTFAAVRDICRFKERCMSVPCNSTVGEVYRRLVEEFESLKCMKDKLLFAVNESYCDESKILFEDDIIAIFPPVSGG
ncbi:MAG: MoaD/ThiS family protein [Spirochaetota bacterium]|nr:MoaD/ThiS family protein [Spirochaetota bacterium]